MFHGEYDLDKAESWTHELERIFETMECAEEDQVFHGEYFPDYARRERRDQFHALVQDDLTVLQYHQRFVRLLRHQQQPQQVQQRGRGRGRVMALTREQAEASNLVIGFLEGLLRNPARLEMRQPRRPRSCRDGAPGRDMVATLLSVALRTPILGSLLREYSGLRVRSSETSQQRQGARQAEETGR
ncbi:hypothetical protein Taro_043680 [Colocasia esculenta]|uniref:Retrotransposon gag domain-containing protein n=1 Tax=Colocasia esculenta TaxID=4460 RepID=A0A843X1Z8_COLES|nr:hypothetical protein [Colocasia esculenta]